MSNQPNLLARIALWFRMGAVEESSPLEKQAAQQTGIEKVQTRRLGFLRPFAKRDEAINGLQRGVVALSGLMDTIRDSLEKQGRRQDEMISYLSHLPEILHSLPEAQRIQGETLKAIGQQLQHQVNQQAKIAEILARVNESSGDQKQLMEALHERTEMIYGYNERISSNLCEVSTAMQSVGKTAEDTSHVLKQLEQDLNRRDTQVIRLIQRQNVRFTVMLLLAMMLATAAILVAGVIGFQLLNTVPQQPAPPTTMAPLDKTPAASAAPEAAADPNPATQPSTEAGAAAVSFTDWPTTQP